MDGRGDAFARVPFAVRIVGARHPIICLAVFQQCRRFPHDAVLISAHQLCCSGDHCFGPFGLLAQDQDRFAERGPFLLNPPESVISR